MKKKERERRVKMPRLFDVDKSIIKVSLGLRSLGSFGLRGFGTFVPELAPARDVMLFARSPR